VRNVDDIVSEAVPHGLELREVVDMPANNLSLVLVKSARQTQLEFASPTVRFPGALRSSVKEALQVKPGLANSARPRSFHAGHGERRYSDNS
jgi:hypothetical protein